MLEKEPRTHDDAESSQGLILTILDRISDSILALDKNWHYTYVNKKGAEHFKKSPEEIIGQPMGTLFPEGVGEPFYKAYYRAMDEQEHIHLEEYYQPLQRWFENDIYPSKDGITILFRDITQHKVAENALRKNEEDYKSLFDTMTQGVMYQDAAGQITSMNPAAENILGINRGEIKDTNFRDHLWKTIHEDGTDFPGDTHPSMRALETGQKLKNVIMGIKISDQEGYRWLKVDAVPQFRPGEQKPFQVYTLFEDITQQKKAEMQLEISEKNYRAIFENSGVAILTFDDEGTVCMFNSEWEELSGYTREEIEGKRKWSEFVHPDYLEMMLKFHQQRIKDPDTVPHKYESSFIKHDGSQCFMYVAITPLPGTDKWLASATDITNLKKTQNKLEKNMLRFRALVEYNVDGIITTDAYGKILYFNNSLLNMFGYTKNELENSSLTILMPKHFRERFKETLKKFRFTGEHRLVGRTIETRGLRKDETVFPFQMSLTKWEIAGKIYFTSIIRDITRQKDTEEKVKEHLKKLTIINQVIKTANNVSTIQGLLEDILNSTIDLLGFEGGGIYLREENNKGFVELKYYENLPPEFLENVRRINIDEPPYSTVYYEGKPIFDYIRQKPEIEALTGFKSAAVIPLFSAGKVIGSLNVVSREKSVISDLEKDILASISMETGTVIARMVSESAIKESLKEKEVLLREIHHRVKNNMQIISSLLNLQIQYEDLDETIDVLKDSQGRVKSMAMIHEKLYQSSNFSNINIKEYIMKLVWDIFNSYGINTGAIEAVVDFEDINLNIDTSIPLGLIVNELVTNSVKYAFPQGRGKIVITLQKKYDDMELTLADDGIGLPVEVDLKKTDTIGLQLVNSLTEQLDGKIELDRSQGTKYKIRFKELKYKERF